MDTGGLNPEWLTQMLPWQRVNHFLGIIKKIIKKINKIL
jgi:hypothetical protein